MLTEDTTQPKPSACFLHLKSDINKDSPFSEETINPEASLKIMAFMTNAWENMKTITSGKC